MVSSSEKAKRKTSLYTRQKLEGTIRDGDKVEFDVGETEKGPNAVKVKASRVRLVIFKLIFLISIK